MSKRYVAAVGFLIVALVVAAAASAGGAHRSGSAGAPDTS